MRYIIILLIFIFSFNIAFAEESVDFFDKVDQKIFDPVKRLFDSIIKEGVEEKSQEMMNKAQNIIKEQQEELLDKAQEKIKEEVKTRSRIWLENKLEWVKNELAPLKIRIQEGSKIIREWIEGVKKYWK